MCSYIVEKAKLYGTAKDCTQSLLTRFFSVTDVSFAWARIFHLFGAGEHPARFVPSLVIALKEGREARCRHGQLTRDFKPDSFVRACNERDSLLLGHTERLPNKIRVAKLLGSARDSAC